MHVKTFGITKCSIPIWLKIASECCQSTSGMWKHTKVPHSLKDVRAFSWLVNHSYKYYRMYTLYKLYVAHYQHSELIWVVVSMVTDTFLTTENLPHSLWGCTQPTNHRKDVPVYTIDSITQTPAYVCRLGACFVPVLLRLCCWWHNLVRGRQEFVETPREKRNTSVNK